MKKGIVIVNTVRRDLINEEAMLKVLEEGKVFSVGLDVFENEPHVEAVGKREDCAESTYWGCDYGNYGELRCYV